MLAHAITAPDVGTGPHGVDHSEEDGFFYLTRDGVRTGKSYPLGKTAYRTARKLNDAEPLTAAVETFGPGPNSQELETKDATPTPPVKTPKAKRVNAPKTKAAKPAKAPKPAPVPETKPEKPKANHKATHSTVVYAGTREEWLNAFVAAARPIFAERGHPIPDKVRVSVGFTGARGGKKVLGACWHEEASTDGTREIFVVPTIDDSSQIAGIVTHELCHTLFGPDEKHGRNFAKAVHDLGLEGKATSAGAGHLPDVEWHEWADPILAALGNLPHAALDPTKSGVKKQKTRLLKGCCEDCGFTVRLTAKWVNAAKGPLQCPDSECGGVLGVIIEGEEPEGEEG